MKRIYSLLLMLALLSSGSAVAQWAQFPTDVLDSRTLRIQSKVESLYERGDYKRAHFIYSSELARKGDKYAQYMTGYMYLMGQGTEQDRVRASAWYRMAAERGVPEFVAVRDQLLETLTDSQRAKSDELYIELRQEYSDLAIIMGLLVEDLEVINEKWIGSRLSGNSSPVTVIDPKTGMVRSAANIRNRDVRTAQIRLDFVTNRLNIGPIKAEQADRQLEFLWERVRDDLSRVGDEAEGLYASP